MNDLVANPAFVAAFIAIMVAFAGLLQAFATATTTRANTEHIIALSKQSAKHEEQLNGGFNNRVKAAVAPDITAAVNRADSSSQIPKVQ